MAQPDHDTSISPFAPAQLADVPQISGVRFATCAAGIKYQGRTDLMLALLTKGTAVAGVLTKSKTCSAAVSWCRETLAAGAAGTDHAQARALVVNSGNANAFTGQRGRDAVKLTARAAADAAQCDLDQVLLASTGVIGEPMQAEKFTHLLAGLADTATTDHWHEAARAIMTTDTFPKLCTRTVDLGGTPVHLNGFCKGAGMIAPDMATMLAFIFTDAPIAAPVLQELLARYAKTTFNCMTIDGDTSTSDTLLAFATGTAQSAGAPKITNSADPQLAGFAEALHDLMREMAILVAKDGEGLTKFVTINVAGAQSWEAARIIGLAIANSPLVKTAIAGEDPNWGRIVMAVGKSGEAAERDKLAISFGDIEVAHQGERAPNYSETAAAAYMKNPEIEINVDVGIGEASATIWTCDLTHGYITINADYRS